MSIMFQCQTIVFVLVRRNGAGRKVCCLTHCLCGQCAHDLECVCVGEKKSTIYSKLN